MPEQADLPPLTALLKGIPLPELGPGPRSQRQSLAALKQEIESVLNSVRLPFANQELIRATLLLWHDYLEDAHTIAQQIDSPDGSYVHGIMHRREPDYGNAKYWFRRVGKHPCFTDLAEKTRPLLRHEHRLESKLIARGEWDPFAFIEACEATVQRAAPDSQGQLLRAIQGIELELLLERFCRTAVK